MKLSSTHWLNKHPQCKSHTPSTEQLANRTQYQTQLQFMSRQLKECLGIEATNSFEYSWELLMIWLVRSVGVWKV